MLKLREGDAATGDLFGSLWGPYDEVLFDQSVDLFERRLRLKGFDPAFFAGKDCLDAGCGGGRNAIAMARLGAAKVVGVDLGIAGIADARKRGAGMDGVSFLEASIESLPFPDDSFDVVWCAGVLMHTGDPESALAELARVLRPGGLIYLLVYATGGLRWPLVSLLRPIAAEIGLPSIEAAVTRAGLAPNKRRTFVDDLFAPRIDFYSWPRLADLLARHGFEDLDRWGPEARLDHEQDLVAYRTDLALLEALFEAGRSDPVWWRAELFERGAQLTAEAVATIDAFDRRIEAGELTIAGGMERVVGQGHHRVFATLAG